MSQCRNLDREDWRNSQGSSAISTKETEATQALPMKRPQFNSTDSSAIPWQNSRKEWNGSGSCKKNYWHLHDTKVNRTRKFLKKRRTLFYLILYLQGCQVITSKHLMQPIQTKLRQQPSSQRKCNPNLECSQLLQKQKGSNRLCSHPNKIRGNKIKKMNLRRRSWRTWEEETLTGHFTFGHNATNSKEDE